MAASQVPPAASNRAGTRDAVTHARVANPIATPAGRANHHAADGTCSVSAIHTAPRASAMARAQMTANSAPRAMRTGERSGMRTVAIRHGHGRHRAQKPPSYLFASTRCLILVAVVRIQRGHNDPIFSVTRAI